MQSDGKQIRRGRALLGPRWTKVRRDVLQHKVRTVLVVLAIAIGIVGAGAVLDTWSLLRRVTRGEFASSNPASATLDTESIDPALLERIRAMPAIRDVQARRTVLGSARTASGWRTAIFFAVDDFTAIRIGIVKPESGAWPPPDGGVVVEASSVEFAGTSVGDSLSIQLRDAVQPRMLPVAGIARDVGLAPGWMEHVVYGFVTRATLAQLGAPSSLDELQIIVANRGLDREGVRRIAFDVREVIESTGREVTNVDVPVPGRHIHAGQIDSLLFTQGAFGVLALLLSGFLVVNLIAAMLAGQVREIGVMKAIGAREGQIAWMYLGLAFGLGLVACAVALPLAAFLGQQYAEFTADMLNFDIAGFRIPSQVILLQLAVGALLPVAAAAIPVTRGCRISVSEALRDFGIDHVCGSTNRRLMRYSRGLSRPMLLSLRNAFRRRQRMILTLTTLAVGGAVYLGSINLRASIRGSVDLLFESMRFDMVLRFDRSWPADSLEAAIAAVPGVAQVEAWGGTQAAFAGPDSMLGNTFPLSAPPAASRLFVPSLRKGRGLEPGDGNTLVVNRRLLADEPRLALGSEVMLLINGQTARWRVVGVVDTGPSPAAYTWRETLAKVTGDNRMDRAVVESTVGGAASQLELVQRLRTELESQGFAIQTSQLMEQSRRVMEDHLLMVAGFLGVMSQLMIVVGGLGLASTMSLSVLERTREIGVLRAIGASHRAILTMIQFEGLVVAIASWILALPLSIPMSVVLGKAFGRIMLPVPVILVPEPSGVLRWLAVALVVSIAACAWPALRATRITTAAALAYE
ncbi:MAG TPA: FtsX-like permease family protein [Candidatus Krumholzibacteria bacterium]|nr:FtsX-like permease family protein [Candidatus Krumholzibacteria bacterium]